MENRRLVRDLSLLRNDMAGEETVAGGRNSGACAAEFADWEVSRDTTIGVLVPGRRCDSQRRQVFVLFFFLDVGLEWI